MNNKKSAIFFMVLLSCNLYSYTAYSQKVVIGWVEQVAIGMSQLPILAKIDTGADHSSINVSKPKVYYKGRQQWVKFIVKNAKGESISVDKEVFRYANIKKKSVGLQRRIVIKMKVCIGNFSSDAQINLVDRNHFRYQLLIGRSILRKHFLVDSSIKHLTTPNCLN